MLSLAKKFQVSWISKSQLSGLL